MAFTMLVNCTVVLFFSFCRGLAKEEDTQFRALEVLMLDENKLSSGVFSSLKNLKRLFCGFLYRI